MTGDLPLGFGDGRAGADRLLERAEVAADVADQGGQGPVGVVGTVTDRSAPDTTSVSSSVWATISSQKRSCSRPGIAPPYGCWLSGRDLPSVVMEANKPVLLTVDDDLGVSRAVARDLRRRYGQDHRIVRAESGRQALEALREIKLRGDPVAVLLADYRMPEMSGLEFLEQAMDLFPHARRALLTAYADTDAAIQAINVIDLDHYLLERGTCPPRGSTRWWTS